MINQAGHSVWHLFFSFSDYPILPSLREWDVVYFFCNRPENICWINKKEKQFAVAFFFCENQDTVSGTENKLHKFHHGEHFFLIDKCHPYNQKGNIENIESGTESTPRPNPYTPLAPTAESYKGPGVGCPDSHWVTWLEQSVSDYLAPQTEVCQRHTANQVL